MEFHQVNLAIRFMLELAALIAAGVWGWRQLDDGWLRFVLLFGIPLVLALIWGTFAVPDDPSRSGGAPVVTPGIIRLIIELTFFGFAIWALSNIGFTKLSITMGIIVLLHYIFSYDRIIWLLSQ